MTKNWMRFGRSVACLSLAALLGACAASVKKDPGADKVAVPAASAKRMVLQMTGPVEVVQSKDWEPFKGEWRSALGGAASSAGMSFESVEAAGVAAAADRAGTLVKVDVKDYRYVTPGARFGLGVMTGNAFVDANVSFIDVQTASSATTPAPAPGRACSRR